MQTQLNWSPDLEALRTSTGPKLVAFFRDTVDTQTVIVAQMASFNGQSDLQCCSSGFRLDWLTPYAWANITHPTPDDL